MWENSLNLLPLCCPDNPSLIHTVQSWITTSAPPTTSALWKLDRIEHTHTQHTHNTQNTRTQTQNSSDIFLLSWKEWLHQSFRQISRREEDFFWSGLSGNNTATLWCRFCFVWCSGTRCHSDRDTYFSVNVTRRPTISCVHAFEWLERVDEWEEKRKKIFWMYIKRAPEDKRVCVCVWVCVCVCVNAFLCVFVC